MIGFIVVQLLTDLYGHGLVDTKSSKRLSVSHSRCDVDGSTPVVGFPADCFGYQRQVRCPLIAHSCVNRQNVPEHLYPIPVQARLDRPRRGGVSLQWGSASLIPTGPWPVWHHQTRARLRIFYSQSHRQIRHRRVPEIMGNAVFAQVNKTRT